MNTLLMLPVQCWLAALCLSAPLEQNSDFGSAVDHGKSLVKKLLSAIPPVHAACVTSEGLSLQPSAEIKNLEYITTVLNIPPAPKLVQISETHTLEVSLKNMAQGLELHQFLLHEVKDKLKCSEKLTALMVDIRDLSAQIRKVQQVAQITPTELQTSSSSLSSRLSGDYQVQVAIHVILQQVRAFGQDIFRSLRQIAHIYPPYTPS